MMDVLVTGSIVAVAVVWLCQRVWRALHAPALQCGCTAGECRCAVPGGAKLSCEQCPLAGIDAGRDDTEKNDGH